MASEILIVDDETDIRMLIAGILEDQTVPGESDVFVLGDAPVLYVILQQEPPWHVNLYNMSPLQDQRKVVRWLQEAAPRFVVFDRTEMSFDNVPNHVRVPLVYQEVVESYQFDRSIDGFDVLSRRVDGEPDADYWSAALSPVIDLGYVPNVGSYEELRPCNGPSGCGSFLVLERSDDTVGNEIVVPLRFGNTDIAVRFTVDERDSSFVIPLRRTWAWALSRDVQLSEPLPPGWKGHT
jgi:CheY-like chemotaxis protein